MEIEKVPKQVWIDTISGKIAADFESLALKVLLERLKLSTKFDSSSKAFEKCAGELMEFFIKTRNMQSVQRDLQKILGKGGIK
jgi:hypothetical protein